VLARDSTLSFSHQVVVVPELGQVRLLDIQPVPCFDQNLWVALTDTGDLLRVDLDAGATTVLCPLPPSTIDLGDAVSLHLSDDGQVAAVANTNGLTGVVLDLTTGKVKMSLERDDYHPEHCVFPIAFCQVDGQLLLIHARHWNRLDLSDPRTGEPLSIRSPTSYAQGEPRPEHYLNYFHSGLLVSPSQKYVADNGWVWHPVGIVTTWSIPRWRHHNVWESEDGESRRALCWRNWYWNGPICWLEDDRLAVWGYGEDHDWLLPAVRIFDAASGQEERWFPGPRGNLLFDNYLFSSDSEDGTSVWDVATGERLLRDENFVPWRYHRGTKTFLSVRPDGRMQVTRLRGQPVDAGWLAANGGIVAQLARAIEIAQSFEDLPVLADALEEAGCQDRAILRHCRQPGPHGTGCWVINLLLDKE
jgi:hypothetical protein